MPPSRETELHWLVSDESNVDPSQGDFFIYGGLVLTDQQMIELHHAVGEVREQYGYQPGDDFKFQSSARPTQVSIEQARLAKQEALNQAQRLGVRMIVNVILHRIANDNPKKRMTYAMNTVIWNFYRLTREDDETGVVCIDRVDETYGYEHLKDLFQRGLRFQSGPRKYLNDRIIHYGMSSNNASHISSVVDIAIGGFRYCVNTAGGKGNTEAAGNIFPTLASMMWSKEVNGQEYIGGYGYIERPRNVQVDSYREQYRELRLELSRYAGAEAEESPDADNPK